MLEVDDFEIKEELAEDGSKIGVEAENEDVDILEPFDPNSISIESKDLPGQIQFLSFGLGFVYSFKRVE